MKSLPWITVGIIAVGGLVWVVTREPRVPDSMAGWVPATPTTQANSQHFLVNSIHSDESVAPIVSPSTTEPAALANVAPTPVDNLSDKTGRVVSSEKFDLSVVQEIQKRPRNAQPALAAKLAESSHLAMRYQALLILKESPPQSAADGMRKLVGDNDPQIAMPAAAYLAGKANDAEARALLLKNATNADPLMATPAIQALGTLGGEDVGEVLVKVMENAETPKAILLAAISAAGTAKATKCVPALTALLDNRELRKMYPDDNARVCDIAAANLEEIVGSHRLPVGAYFTASLPERDEAIAAWKEWGAQQAAHPDLNPRTTLADKLFSQQLVLLSKDTTADARHATKVRLQQAFRTDFCLGDLPGVTALVAPSAGDEWRIMQANGEDCWFRSVGYWQELDLAYERQFLTHTPPPPDQSDEQAAAFIVFADTTNMPKVWIWSFCRDFADIWPKSVQAPSVAAIQERIAADFAKEHKKIVLHGRIAVAEPIPPPPVEHPTMVQEGYGAITGALAVNPSSWELHRAAVAYFTDTNSRLDVYHKLTDFSAQYPGNEWPFIGAAAYELRLRKRLDRGLDYANRALLLNEANAKAYAIRGMLRVTLGKDTNADLAVTDLKRAYELDLKSLGDEPETHAAIAFLIEKALEAKDNARAKEYLKTLSGLRAFGTERPFRDTDAYVKLTKAAE